MKTTVVPAQITTVEDKITSSLTALQLGLLVAAGIVCVCLYVVVPPFNSLSTSKFAFIVIAALLVSSFAFRIGDRILLRWVIILIKYWSRPKKYIFDKNDSYIRRN